MPRREFSRKTKRDRFAHCGGKCEDCGAKLRPGHFAYDHAEPTGWLKGDNSFGNCRVRCQQCHTRKSARESGERAKSNRIRDKAIGAMSRKDPPLPCGRNSPWKRTFYHGVVRRT
jgi:hypothetical protein